MPGEQNAIDTIKVRMYNTGSVGDCFLLLFQKGDVVKFKMMIDCGGIKTTEVLVKPCMEDIFKTCGGKLDLLLVTHQHEDHLSGFNLARSVFDKMYVEETWMSWVENESDDLGQLVKKKYGKKLKETQHAFQLKLAAEKKRPAVGSNSFLSARQKLIRQNMNDAVQLLEFEAGRDHHALAAKGSRTNDDAMVYLKTKGRKMKYRKPGEILSMPNAEGIRFYVLGPPRDPDLKFLKIETRESEMYHLALSARKASEPPAEALLSDIESMLTDNRSPFEEGFAMKGTDRRKFNQLYNAANMKWRQIEDDWKESASEIALALTRLTNNTSLAIALEFTSTGTVMLLPADAQSGNWMSWHKKDVNDEFKRQGGKEINELLQKTVFYKVGHHASHNGTASLSGLDQMSHENLVAFIPLIQAKVPTTWGGSKNFPASKLYSKLIEKTKGRLVRTDEGAVTDPVAKTLRSQLSAADQTSFKKQLKEGPCYFEYTVQG